MRKKNHKKGRSILISLASLVVAALLGCGISVNLENPTPVVVIATETPPAESTNTPEPTEPPPTSEETEEPEEAEEPEEEGPEEPEETEEPEEEGPPLPALPPGGAKTPSGTECSLLVQPGGSIQDAVDGAVPGDVLCIAPGTYSEEVHIAVSGESGKPIIISNTSDGEVVMDGGAEFGSAFIFEQGASQVMVSGVTIRNYSVWGVDVEGDNEGILLDNLDVSGGEAGMHFTVGDSGEEPVYGPVDNIIVSKSQVHDTEYTAVDCTPGPCNHMVFTGLLIEGAGLTGESSFGADGLAVERGKSILVEDCVIRNNGGDGIDLNSRDTEGYAEEVLVRNNALLDNRMQGIKLWAGGRMENNVVVGSGINPVVVGIFPSKVEVVGNTVAYNMWDASYSSRDYSFVAAYPEIGYSPPVELVLKNNVFAFNTGPKVGESTGIYLGEGVTVSEKEGNVFFSRGDCEIQADFLGEDNCISREGVESGGWGMSVDPMFVSGPPDLDLNMQADSPAHGTGALWGGPY